MRLTRRGFVAALAGLPVVGKLAAKAFHHEAVVAQAYVEKGHRFYRFDCPAVDGAGQAGSRIRIKVQAGTRFDIGDTWLIEQVRKVPTYKGTSFHHIFVVTRSLVATGQGDELDIFPAIIPNGIYRNASQTPADGARLIRWSPGMEL